MFKKGYAPIAFRCTGVKVTFRFIGSSRYYIGILCTLLGKRIVVMSFRACVHVCMFNSFRYQSYFASSGS